ncbi:N-methylhydantoinase B/acetone carboxylase, alpha subunit [Halogeometricum borinquense DSM 11551]|uniref:N-methylhydantoinase B/acetone carboxylase, alpha subunit n=2 Tax=Halogeometricum borinquense (strain ATCC 700274 / DSM 11551 / JCM 10706 / KCTC 4070 / PR3) TaxID=469382 RepID=L9ULB3_HALBP|nr:hydantoinase B/oxoprolinase family protein [Halogeometricum borinquense]ELY25664.1 N-methylhydantoinase B/acetone carboxylase, alpha subunit [Halogeometricum borinquense DSM 11551]
MDEETDTNTDMNAETDSEVDAITLEIMRNQFESVAEEMGQVLITSSYSPNIKERRDCSTALFDADGRLVAQAEHIPVHLGAMPEAVQTVLGYDPKPGDVFVLNDPFEGGTHLPDVTMVSPLSLDGEILGFVVSRAHHADVGGMAPGSMPAGAREIYQEGLRLPPVRLVEGGEVNDDVMSVLLANVRNPGERRADIRAQIAANERAEERLGDLVEEHGKPQVVAAFDAVMAYSRDRVTAELRALPDGEYHARDVLEGDGVTDEDIPIEVTVSTDGETVAVDFDGTAPQVAGNVNAPLAVAKSAVYFVVRCVTDPEIPPNQGCYDPITVSVPEGTLLNPNAPAAVVGGNVETSQRVTDVVFTALAEAAPDRVPAQGQGTMNNLTIGSRAGGSEGFTYYETIGGGFGGRASGDGMDGVQVGMTNTLNTPIEALEAEYPLFVEEYSLRENSGGRGRYRGGLGIVRSVTIEADATVSLLTERRRVAPKGIAGGEDGATGQNLVDGESVPAKTTRDVLAGTTVTVRTPGGGGHGTPEDRSTADKERDAEDGKVKR